jgi:biopolymer transport protein ExbB
VYIWVERYNAIQKANKIDTSFMENLKNNVSKGKINEAKAICSEENTPVGRMMHKGISRLGRPVEDISTSIENVANIEVSNMEKKLIYFGNNFRCCTNDWIFRNCFRHDEYFS